jgi:uroporphyrinogen III methyltransferase/synthase
VVRLRDQLAWHDAQPLAGRRILVPRVRHRPSEIVRLLKAAGAETTEVPVLRGETLEPPPDLLQRLAAPDWLVFASPGAVAGLLEQLGRIGRDVRALGEARLAAIGPAGAAHLRRCGLRVDYAPETASGFAGGFPAPAAAVLLVGEDGGDPHVVRDLEAVGASCSELPVTSLVVDDRAPQPPLEQFDGIALASSNTVRRLAEVYPEGPLERQLVVSIGPMTTATARTLGVRVDLEAPVASPVSVAQCFVEGLGCSLVAQGDNVSQ